MKLRTKTSLSISLFIVVVLISHTLIYIRQEEKDEKSRLLLDGISYAKLTSEQVTFNYERYYHNAFYTFLSYIKDLYQSNEDLFEIQLVDVNGNILLDLEEINTSAPSASERRISLADWEYSELMSIVPEYRYLQRDDRKLLEISYPVLLQGGMHRHTVFYYYSFDALEHRLSQMKNSSARLMLLYVLIGFLGASLFSYGLTRNLGNLVSHAHKIAEGNLDEPITLDSKDEFGELATSFEYMRSELRKKNGEIASYNRKLEEKVQKRTAELQELTVQLKNNNIILQRANEKLMELDRLKSEFLANTSHELRTPLTSIIGYSQCMLAELDGPLPAPQRKNIHKILSSGKDLLALINRILDFSKIESGTIILHEEEINIKELIDEAVTMIRPMSEEKGLSVISNVASDLPHPTGDRMRIKQAIINLLSNAVKFTEKGFVRVSAARHNGELQISVKDTGIGIPSEQRETIFEAFRQVDGSVQRKYGGSGLGLTISRRLIELHRGKLWVESQEGVGTTFSFTLPIEKKESTDGARIGENS
jgi:signal transduction histidine kinase